MHIKLTIQAMRCRGFPFAHVEFRRPELGFRDRRDGQYANVYNPFWQPRIVGTNLLDIPKAFPQVDVVPLEEL